MTDTEVQSMLGRLWDSSSDVELLAIATDLRMRWSDDPDARTLYRFTLERLRRAARSCAHAGTARRPPGREALSD